MEFNLNIDIDALEFDAPADQQPDVRREIARLLRLVADELAIEDEETGEWEDGAAFHRARLYNTAGRICGEVTFDGGEGVIEVGDGPAEEEM